MKLFGYHRLQVYYRQAKIGPPTQSPMLQRHRTIILRVATTLALPPTPAPWLSRRTAGESPRMMLLPAQRLHACHELHYMLGRAVIHLPRNLAFISFASQSSLCAQDQNTYITKPCSAKIAPEDLPSDAGLASLVRHRNISCLLWPSLPHPLI